MQKYHPMKSLAPRDVVARAIDSEMKRTGEECVYLDIRHHDEETLRRRFPNIFAKCLEAGINMAKDLIPVVPAAHFVCGGIKTDVNGESSIQGLFAVGESGCTGLHGANRLASNSLLEALVVPKFAAKEIERKYPNVRLVVAHIGRAYSKEDIGDAFEVLRNTRHMLFDFTANVCDDAIKACIRAVGTKRLLFGSDLPIAIMRMYRVVEGGVYRNVVPRGLYGDVSGDPHMRQTDETDITLMIYEELRALKRCAFDLKLSDLSLIHI